MQARPPPGAEEAVSEESKGMETAWLQSVLLQHGQLLEVEVPQLANGDASLQQALSKSGLSETQAITRRAMVLRLPNAARAHAGGLAC